MCGVNDVYTDAEKRSMELWDAWCQAMPLTSQERKEIRERDRYAASLQGGMSTGGNPGRYADEQQRQKNREYAETYRRNHQETIRAYNAAHADEIRERCQEYNKFYR